MDQPTSTDESNNEVRIREPGELSLIARRDIQNLFLVIALGIVLYSIAKQATTSVPQVNVDPALISTGFRVNVNSATADEISLLPQVGPVLAERIVAERVAHGPFISIGDLARTPGIGPDRISRFQLLVETDH